MSLRLRTHYEPTVHHEQREHTLLGRNIPFINCCNYIHDSLTTGPKQNERPVSSPGWS